MRGSFPYDICYNNTADQFTYLGTLAQGIPDVPIPDISSGRVKLPQGIFIRSPNPNDVDRGTIQQWNVAFEYRWPFDVATEFAYVGTAHRRRLCRPEHQLRHARRRQRVAAVLRPRRHHRHQRLGVAHQEPLQWPADRHQPAVQQGPPPQGRLHAEQVEEHGGRRRLGRPRPATARSVYDQNFATAGFDRTHVFQMGFVYALPLAEGLASPLPARSSTAGRSTASSPPTRARRSPSAAPTTR